MLCYVSLTCTFLVPGPVVAAEGLQLPLQQYLPLTTIQNRMFNIQNLNFYSFNKYDISLDKFGPFCKLWPFIDLSRPYLTKDGNNIFQSVIDLIICAV